MAETRIRLDKQIQKAPANRMVPLSNANGELQYTGIDALIKTGETQTVLNSVEVTGGNLVIKYTGENGEQQVVSTALNYAQTDINVSGAVLENPSAGVYRLLITETDGSTYPVDLSALLAVVTQNTEYTVLSGNGTPQNPLKVELTQTFWDSIPRNIHQMEDTQIDEGAIETELNKGGATVLVYEVEMQKWIPRSTNSFDPFTEVTETFRDLKSGNSVNLQRSHLQIVPGSLKVFRNGLRQDYGEDYTFGEQGGNQILFTVSFTQEYEERIIVDYRPLTA